MTAKQQLTAVIRIAGGVGVASLAMAFLTGHPGGPLGIAGVLLLLAAAGAAFLRWVYFRGPLADAIDRALQAEAERKQRAHLDELQQRLKDDPDPRTLGNLAKLRRLRDRFRSGPFNTAADPLLAEVRGKSLALYESCLSSLERVAEQGAAARQMATPEARETLLRSRNDLLDEVTQGVDRLGASIDQLQVSALASDAGPEKLAEIRNELDAGLEVARRVQERMNELDRRVRDV